MYYVFTIGSVLKENRLKEMVSRYLQKRNSRQGRVHRGGNLNLSKKIFHVIDMLSVALMTDKVCIYVYFYVCMYVSK